MKSFYEKWGWLMLIPILGWGLLGDDKGHTYLTLFGLSIFTLIIALFCTVSDEVGEEEQNSKERNMVKRLLTKDMAVLWWIIFGVLAVITYVYYEDNWYRF